MQSRVDHYLPRAFDAIKIVRLQKGEAGKSTQFLNTDGTIAREYKGYISSLGANIVQAGVRAAITFYEAEESGSEKDRRIVNAAIKYIIDGPDSAPKVYSDCKLSALLKANNEEFNQQMALNILDAATALKLALRTYLMK